MAGIQTNNGKAFEYACLIALYQHLNQEQEIIIRDTPQYRTAKRFFDNLDEVMKRNLMLAGNASARVLIRLEPQLEYPNRNVPLILTLQTDAEGIKGDVRDVLCIRRQNEWEIGLSCKHNHFAVKHSRLSGTIDFGREWFGIPCSTEYFQTVRPLFNELRGLKENSYGQALWQDLPNKEGDYYIPILLAFMKELKKLDAENNGVIPERLIHYLIGQNDFYKVITIDNKRITRIQAVNINGTLNRKSAGHSSMVDISKLKLPSRFYHIDFVPNSTNTIENACDEGWTISLRIHNASSRIEPSLKFDINLVSLPSSIYSQVEPWDNY